MKKVLSIVLIFVLVLAALLGVSALWERVRPAKEEPAEADTRETKTITNTMDTASATVISLAQGGTTIAGLGAEVKDDRVTIAYPGTYLVTGTLTDGQLIVDLGDFSGAVYILFNGVSIICPDGPALYTKQADLTAVYLVEGTENSLRDGESYLVAEGPEKKTGAGIYSADDLLIWGDGSLTVTGLSADGIRSKDALYLAGGSVTVYAADDGVQASDFVYIYDGDLTISCYGDGVKTTEGEVAVYGGSLSIASAGDGIAAITTLDIQAGGIAITTYGGTENYETVALNDLSAKGLKAETITISGGTLALNTADDGIHAARDACITGGSISIASGDDGIHAAGTLDIRGVTLDIPASYEAIEGDSVLLSNVTLTATAENNAIDAGEGGCTAYSVDMTLDAPRAISSDGALDLYACAVDLHADGTDSLFAFTEAELVGCTVAVAADTGRSEVLLAKGTLPGTLLFGFSEAIPAGTEFILTEPGGETVYAVSFASDASAVMLSLDGLLDGQTYALTVGENAVEFTYDADGCFVSEPEPVRESRQGGFPGMPGGGRR